MANYFSSRCPDIGTLGEDLVAQWLQSTVGSLCIVAGTAVGEKNNILPKGKMIRARLY